MVRMSPPYGAAGLSITGPVGLPIVVRTWHHRVRMLATGAPSVIDFQAPKPSYVSAAPERCP
jgi:hypothetical protein